MFYRITSISSSMATGAIAASPLGQYGWIASLMPMVVSVIMVIMVRALIDMKSRKKERWNYNLLVMAFCSLFTAVLVHEWSLSVGSAMMFGIGAGATGVGIIGYGKTGFAKAMEIRDLLKSLKTSK